MALSLVDIEMDLPEDVYKDESFSKEGLCGSPFSQASTAPCTPIRFFLPDPFFDVPPLQPSFSLFVLQPPLSICSYPCWTEYKQAAEPDIARAPAKPKRRKVHVPKALLMVCVSPWWAQYKQGWKESIPPVLRIAAPSLKSELAIWTPKVVATRDQPTNYAPRSQQEFAVLELVGKDEHPVKGNMKDHLSHNLEHFTVWEFVTTHEHKVEHVDLVEDGDWAIHGPTQDTEQDSDEDEWFHIDELYTPSVLEDMCVLTANPDSVGMAGHALTPDGRVIDLNGGRPVAFSFEAEHSSGHARKVAAISMAKASSDALLAKAACNVDNETVCSIDTTGTLRGGAAMDAPAVQTKKDRLKLFHQKRTHRQMGIRPSNATRHSQVFSVDASGRLFLFNVKRARRMARVKVSNTFKSVMTIAATGVVHDILSHEDVLPARCMARAKVSNTQNSVMTIDATGLVHDIVGDLCRGIDIDADVVLAIDAKGVIRIMMTPFE